MSFSLICFLPPSCLLLKRKRRRKGRGKESDRKRKVEVRKAKEKEKEVIKGVENRCPENREIIKETHIVKKQRRKRKTQ